MPADFDDSRLAETRSTMKAVDELLELARAVDEEFGISFDQFETPELPKGRDVWLEIVDVCRTSFAISAIIAPPSAYPYGDETVRAKFADVLGAGNAQLLADVDRVALTDAVENTAAIWSHLWDRVSKLE